MPAYVVVDIEVTDPERYEEYKKLAPPAVAAYGGKYIARGGSTVTLEGGWEPGRLVILQFDTLEQAEAWWKSEEYAAAKMMRHASARSRMVAIEGLLP
jgi:uncharacterized protein (DUF1330 family)